MATLITLSMSLTRYNSTGSWPLSASLFLCCQVTLLSASESDFLRFSKAPVFQHWVEWVVKIMAYFFLMDKFSLSFHNSPILSSFFCLYWTSSGSFCFLAVSSPLPSWTLWGVQTGFSSNIMEILLTQGTNELCFLNLLANFNIRSVECIRKERASLEILSSLGSSTDLSLWVFSLFLSHWPFRWSPLEPPFSAGYLNVMVTQVSASAPMSLCVPSSVAHSTLWCKCSKHASITVPGAQVHKSTAVW